MQFTEEDIRKYFPKYLTEKTYEELKDGIRQFHNGQAFNYYSNFADGKTLYQGDVIKDVTFPELEDGEAKLKTQNCIILSNTCDISDENERHKTQRVLISPLVNMNKYEKLLYIQKGAKSVENITNNIKKQYTSDIFYLPPFDMYNDGAIVRFDMIYNINIETFNKNLNINHIMVNLSQTAWYLLLVKISIHLSRMQENVDRGSP